MLHVGAPPCCHHPAGGDGQSDTKTHRRGSLAVWGCEGVRREYTGMCASILHRLTQMDDCEHVNNIQSAIRPLGSVFFLSAWMAKCADRAMRLSIPAKEREGSRQGKARQREYRVAIECTHPPGVTALPGCVPPACSTGSCDNPVSLSPCSSKKTRTARKLTLDAVVGSVGAVGVLWYSVLAAHVGSGRLLG
jgi:hypothetical protein